MKRMILDGRRMTDRNELYTYLDELFAFPPYFGRTLDSLWDMLSTIRRPMLLLLIHTDDMLEGLGDYGHRLLRLFRDLSRARRNLSFYTVNEDPDKLGQPDY